MLTFAITTTTKLASLSLHNENKVLGEIKIEVAKTHSTTILEQIDKLFSWTGKTLDEVKNVIVSVGPGSFTGVRIAISVVKGLFFGKNVEIFGVNELDALAYQLYFFYENKIKKNDKIYSVISAGKEKIYYAKYNVENIGNLEIAEEHCVGKIWELVEKIENGLNDNLLNENKVYLIGDAIFNFKEKIVEKLGKYDKIEIIEENNLKINSVTFEKMLKLGKLEKTDIYSLKPNYLEKTQAEREKDVTKKIF